MIEGKLAHVWADKPLADIDGHDIHAVVSEARRRGSDGRARKLFAALSLLFGWLQRERRVVANPCSGVWRPGPPMERDRVLLDTEIVAFWQACERLGPPFGPMFRIMLLAGVRLREAAHATRSEIDADGTWTLPASRTKNHRPLALPLPPLARAIIDAVPRIGDAGFLFTTTGNTPVSGFSDAKEKLDAAMAAIMRQPVAAWRLRRSAPHSCQRSRCARRAAASDRKIAEPRQRFVRWRRRRLSALQLRCREA